MWIRLCSTVAVLVCCTSSLFASLQVRLTSGLNSITITDSGPGDVNAAIGATTFSGPVGNFNINVGTGVAQGTANTPSLDLNAIHQSSGGGTLEIAVTLTNIPGNVPLSELFYDLNIGGTTQGTVTANLFADASNTPFGHGETVGTLGTFNTSPFVGFDSVGSVVAAHSPLYSLTLEAIITHGANTRLSSFDFLATGRRVTVDPAAVPEPSSVLIWSALGLLSLVIGKKSLC